MKLHDPPHPAQMPVPSTDYSDEEIRLRVLDSFEPDALEDDPELAAIVQFAAKLCNVPACQVSLVEDIRQRFLVREGIEERETPREQSFCAHAMLTPDLMEVRDTQTDDRFAENALVTGEPGLRFYAGQPLVSEEGAPLGALCVIDLEPRPDGLDDLQREGMAVLAQAVMRRLNARRANIVAQHAIEEREERLRRMIDGVPQIAWSADAKGVFDYFNRRWTELTGAAPPQTTEGWRSFVHPEDYDYAFGEWKRCLKAGEDYEVEYRLKMKQGWVWVLAQGVPVAERAGDPLRWFGTITDIDETHRAFEERDMLAKELSHRIKNIFAVVIGLATLKVRRAPEHKPFVDDLVDVLRALGRAHEFVRPTGERVQDSLTGLLTTLFAAYAGDGGEPRVQIDGYDGRISAKSATPLALIFHELATNSAKYGALSTDSGHVGLEIADEGETIRLRWTEHGGPSVADPDATGFGSRLVEMSITGQLQGSWDRRFEPGGLVVDLTVAKKALAD